MKILVTGGAGFIGSNYVNNLVSQESNWNEIVILDSLTYAGNLANLKQVLTDKLVKFVKGDIRNSQFVMSICVLFKGITSKLSFLKFLNNS